MRTSFKKEDSMINEIKPFKEFWMDCFSTILFSVYSSGKHNKRLIYNNTYQYEIVEAGKSSIHPFKTIRFDVNYNDERIC